MSPEDLFSLQGRVAVVTGGARGVGFMCAEALLSHGADVLITCRDAERGDEAVQALSKLGSCGLIVADLATADGIAELQERLVENVDRLDLLVNNAGVTWGETFERYPREAWTKVLQLDVATPFQVVQATADLLAAAARGDRQPARVINLGSIDGHAVGAFENYAYAAGKAALHQLTRVLALELAPRAITVNAIALGPIMTKMTATLLDRYPGIATSNPLGRIADAEDLAGALVYLSSRAGAYVTGTVLAVDGGGAIPTWGGGRK